MIELLLFLVHLCLHKLSIIIGRYWLYQYTVFEAIETISIDCQCYCMDKDLDMNLDIERQPCRDHPIVPVWTGRS